MTGICGRASHAREATRIAVGDATTRLGYDPRMPSRHPSLAPILVAACAFVARDAAVADGPKPIECRLPFPADAAWKVLEGVGGPTHNDAQTKYAIDFAMTPEGQFVAAVADGVVEFVKKDEKDPSEKHADDNRIVIRHTDGSLGDYAHLQKDGAFVEVGDHVVAGDVIGLSGNTGKSASPRLTFTCRTGDKDGPSVPCRFVEIPDDGVPKTDQVATSQNVAVRYVPGWRTTRDAIDFYKFCTQIGATAVALPLLETSKKSSPKIQHPSIDALLRERDEIVEIHRLASGDALSALKTAREKRDIDALAAFATFGPLDFADLPAVAKEMKAIPTAFGKDPAWAEAVGRLAGRTEFRKLVADAVKEETGAAARFVPKRTDPKARPDYTAAILAWEKARARAIDPDQGSIVRRHAEALKKAR
jgi:murein DD-endopeptidase MepM/ murein hydrolase activator NlpD